MQIEYPNHHKQIVKDLVEGKFLLFSDSHFAELTKHSEFYQDFFLNSFGFKLELKSEYAFLSSTATVERDTRDFTIFLALLCRELELEGKAFKDSIDHSPFNIDEVWEMLKNSTKAEVIESTGIRDFRNFLGRWHRKNLIAISGNTFRFTRAVQLFFEFAASLANEKLQNPERISAA